MEEFASTTLVTKKLIILVNAERLCAYRMLPSDNLTQRIRIEPIRTYMTRLHPDPTDISDDEGNFPSGMTKHRAPMRHGEPHGRIAEKKRRLLDAMALTICELFNKESYEIWNLAAPADIAKRLIKRLPVHLQSKLTNLKKADYTNLPIKRIEHLFST